MKSLIRLLIISIFITFAFSGCYYDKEDMLYISCDLTNVTYKLTIAPVMIRNCNGCHYQGSTSGNGLITDNYTDLSSLAAPGGQLWQAVNGLGVSQMPKNSSKLSSCDLSKIKKWIDDGAPNN